MLLFTTFLRDWTLSLASLSVPEAVQMTAPKGTLGPFFGRLAKFPQRSPGWGLPWQSSG